MRSSARTAPAKPRPSTAFLGFVQPDAGSAESGESAPFTVRRNAKAHGYIPEKVNLYPYFSGIENLAYFTEIHAQVNKRAPITRDFLRRAGLHSAAF
jgi:ABC-2 type transport system ATP-binding protein